MWRLIPSGDGFIIEEVGGGFALAAFVMFMVIASPIVATGMLAYFAYMAINGWLQSDPELWFVGILNIHLIFAFLLSPAISYWISGRQYGRYKAARTTVGYGGDVRSSGAGVAAVIFAILAYFTFLITAPLAWLIGSVALRGINRAPNQFANQRSANGSRIFGKLATLSVVSLIFVMALSFATWTRFHGTSLVL